MNLEEDLKKVVINIPDFPMPGVSFKDVTPIFQNPELSKNIVSFMADYYRDKNVEAIVGLESRGFMFGFSLALALNVPFVLFRKKGKLPRETYEVTYNLEYGQASIEVHRDALKKGQRVLIHDDLLATGGTAMAAAELIKKANAELVGFSFLVELSFLQGRNLLVLKSPEILTFATY